MINTSDGGFDLADVSLNSSGLLSSVDNMSSVSQLLFEDSLLLELLSQVLFQNSGVDFDLSVLQLGMDFFNHGLLLG